MKLDSIPDGARIAVAMSGGVDSSVAAASLFKAGYDVVGITLQLYDHGEMIQKKGACCAGQDIYDARRVAEMLGFPHYVLDYESVFQEAVMEDFADSYMRGETPLPCVRCNQKVKFHDLLKMARDLNCAALVTGHYVRRVEGAHGAELHRAVCLRRDQSYFLFATTQAQLSYLRFPLGVYADKSMVRAVAEELGLAIADKPDSQDICFVPEGKYSAVVAKLRPGALDPGPIMDVEGNILGTHEGIVHFTIGQRKGIGITAPEPLYVIRIDPEMRAVIVGSKVHLRAQELQLKEVNWLMDEALDNLRCQVKVRSTHEPVDAIVYRQDRNKATVTLIGEEYGIAKGQACVFFEGSRVLGGGWIC